MKLYLTRSKEEIVRLFSAMQTRKHVANLLEVDDRTLIYLLYREKEKYRSFYLEKKSGGQRLITAPVSRLKILQRKLYTVLKEFYKARSSVHGFYQGRSIVTNAANHVKKRTILNFDLKDFFPTISFWRVRGLFMAAPFEFPYSVAMVLAQICCYESKLPQGAPTSPIISNMICSRLDGEMQRFAQTTGCIYTRYADDITLSINSDFFPQEIMRSSFEQLGEKLNAIIQGNGFMVNPKKTRVHRVGTRKEVTGLVVNQKINVKKKFMRQVRAMLHAWEVYGLESAQEEYRSKYNIPKKQRYLNQSPNFAKIVEGKINFIKMVRGGQDVVYKNFINQYNRLTKSGFPEYSLDAVINVAIFNFKCKNCGVQRDLLFKALEDGEDIEHIYCSYCKSDKITYSNVF